MAGYNQVTLIGRLVKDPELRYTNSDKAICSFTLAVDKQGDGANFIRCKAWNAQAENINKFMAKGSQICVGGSIETGSYEDKNGNTVYTTDVVVKNSVFLDHKNGGQSGQNTQGGGTTQPPQENGSNQTTWDDITDSDIPF